MKKMKVDGWTGWGRGGREPQGTGRWGLEIIRGRRFKVKC